MYVCHRVELLGVQLGLDHPDLYLYLHIYMYVCHRVELLGVQLGLDHPEQLERLHQHIHGKPTPTPLSLYAVPGSTCTYTVTHMSRAQSHTHSHTHSLSHSHVRSHIGSEPKRTGRVIGASDVAQRLRCVDI